MNQSTGNIEKAGQVCILMILGAIWLCLERYHGFYHDGMLYSMLALYKLHPANFQNDLFVAFGSQDSFTVFPSLFSLLAGGIGLDWAAFLLTAIGQVLWAAALLLLVLRITSGWRAVLAVACLVFCSRYYDAYLMFSYAEPFPTPRIFSEALSLFALTALFDRRYIKASICLVAAMLFHPLMCLYVILLTVITFLTDTKFPGRLRFALSVGGGIFGVALVILRVHPFDGFLHPYDADWYQVFQATSETSTLPSLWTPGTALRVVYLMLVLAIAWWRKVPVFDRWVPPLLGLSLGLFGLWACGAGLWHDQLLIQLQPWRCVWLLQILALIAQGILLRDLSMAGGADRWLAGFMLAALLQVGYSSADGSQAVGFVAVGLLLRALLPFLPEKYLYRAPWNSIPLLVPLPQLLVNGLRAWSVRGPVMLSTSLTEGLQLGFWAVSAALLVVLIWLAWGRRHFQASGLSAVLLAGGMACLASAGYLWSSPFAGATMALEASQQKLIAKIQARVPADAVVYSNYDMLWVWFVLNRSNYADTRQMAGYMFSRGTALEGLRRFHHLCDAGVPGCLVAGFNIPAGTDPEVFWQTHAPFLCSDPALNFLILQGRINGAEIFTDTQGRQTISVVDCQLFHEKQQELLTSETARPAAPPRHPQSVDRRQGP